MFQLPPLPYAYDVLEPVVSETTMRTHHDKHHRKYVDTLNQLLATAGRRPASLEEVVRQAFAAGETKLANNAGQAWNHGFFWQCMHPGAVPPDDALAQAILDFGGDQALKSAFIDEGVAHFGSGWVWIVARAGALEVVTTHDGDTIAARVDVTPLLVCDLWEHAYYLDYRQDRPAFLQKWWDGVADLGFASRQFAAARGLGEPYRYPPPMAEAA